MVVKKMFGSRHTPTPKILFKFSGIFEVAGQAFLKFHLQSNSIAVFKNALVTYVFGRVCSFP